MSIRIDWSFIRPLVVGLCILCSISFIVIACGGKIFPKCGEPGVECPPCRGNEQWPDPCAAGKRDAGVGKDGGR